MDRFFEDGGGQIPKATLDTISSEPTEFAAPGAEPEISEIAALRETNHQLQGRVAALTAERDAAVMAAAEAPELPPLRRQLRDLTRHLASAGKAALARRGDDRELARAQAKVDQLSFRVNELTQQLRAARAAGPARRHPAMVALFTAAVLMGAVATLIIVDITQWHRSVLWAERAVLSARAWWH